MIWRIWPAVLLHTVFAAAVTTVSIKTEYHLDIPNVLMTVLGVVIGFVISYRAMSGYERYWLGRGCWSDIIRNSRTLTRLIWFHVPLQVTPMTAGSAPPNLSRSDLKKVMKEKREALDLVLAYAVALKHHLRGELGIYYQDMYHLVPNMHEHVNAQLEPIIPPQSGSSYPEPLQQSPTSQPQSQRHPRSRTASTSNTLPPDPYIPPINAYGTFRSGSTSTSHRSGKRVRWGYDSDSDSSDSERCHEATALLPSSSYTPGQSGFLSKVAFDLLPFSYTVSATRQWLQRRGTPGNSARDVENGLGRPAHPRRADSTASTASSGSEGEGGVQRIWRSHHAGGRGTHDALRVGGKHHPRVVGGTRGENLPLDVLRALSIWLSTLEGRGSVPGTTMGGMFGCVTALEDSLCSLEKILTTPLPFVYSAHIRHTVWLYLFFMPFQLVSQFGWSTILGTGIASFIYLGFVAAGEEIEQPFGYDENDLDLDLFCHSIMRTDIEKLKRTPCPNVVLGSANTMMPLGQAGEGANGHAPKKLDASAQAVTPTAREDDGQKSPPTPAVEPEVV